MKAGVHWIENALSNVNSMKGKITSSDLIFLFLKPNILARSSSHKETSSDHHELEGERSENTMALIWLNCAWRFLFLSLNFIFSSKVSKKSGHRHSGFMALSFVHDRIENADSQKIKRIKKIVFFWIFYRKKNEKIQFNPGGKRNWISGGHLKEKLYQYFLEPVTSWLIALRATKKPIRGIPDLNKICKNIPRLAEFNDLRNSI